MFSLSASLRAADDTFANIAASSPPPVANGTAPAGAAAATTSEAVDMHATGKHGRHAMRHPSMQRRDALAATATGTGDPAYRAALKECVAGPEGQHDSCLDDAIARFGQS